ncbi:MAG TPA: sensor histidine kinase [Spirochaetales bacterium]|nr:sensor histidine kinase [Spirochaetales bacterium]
MKTKIRNSAAIIAATYAIAATAWIVLSDRLLSFLAGNVVSLAWLQTLKGTGFVVATAVILFFHSKSLMTELVRAQVAREAETLASLREKEALLREIAHRVKNNLQLIASIMSLQGGDSCSPVRDKVAAMALVHELLYSSDSLSRVDPGELADGLAVIMRENHCGVEFHSDGGGFSLDAERAVPVGIFVAEACDNAARHAKTADGSPLCVRLSMHAEDGRIQVTVSDNGHGLAGQASAGSATGVGMALMDAIADQLGGRVDRTDSGGAVVSLSFPLSPSV